MTETTLEAVRSHFSDWPEPVEFRERFLEPLRLSMDTIIANEGRYANIAQKDAANDDHQVYQGDWYKMIRWTVGRHRGAASSPMVQHEIMMAHAANAGSDGAGFGDPLWPGMVISHFGALGNTGGRACNDGHTKLTDYAMRYFVENDITRSPVTWRSLWTLMNYIKEKAANAPNASEGMPWIDAMIQWMSAVPPWSKVVKGGIYATAYQFPISQMGDRDYVTTQYLGHGAYDPMAWRERALPVGSLFLVDYVETYHVIGTLLTPLAEHSDQHIVDRTGLGGQVRMHFPSICIKADTPLQSEIPDGHYRRCNIGDDRVDVPYRHMQSWECSSPLSGRKAYYGTIVRRLTDTEQEQAEAAMQRFTSQFTSIETATDNGDIEFRPRANTEAA